MKQATKTWMILAAALIVIGALLCVVILAMNHWNMEALMNMQYEATQFDTTEDFENITILADVDCIQLLPTDGGSCRVMFYEPDSVECTATVQDGTLTLDTRGDKCWNISSLFGSPKVSVYLPQSAYKALTIEATTGEITLPQDFSFESISVSASTSNITCSASASNFIHMKTTTGSIHMDSLAAESILASTTTGDIRMDNLSAAELSLSVTTGKATLSDISCQCFTSGGMTGSLHLKNVLAAETIDISRSTGDIFFDHCDAASLTVQTTTGDVTGSLRSEKIFLTHSATGHISVPPTAAGGSCKISTSTGNISININ